MGGARAGRGRGVPGPAGGPAPRASKQAGSPARLLQPAYLYKGFHYVQ